MTLILRLAWRNLWRNPRRTLLTAAAIGRSALDLSVPEGCSLFGVIRDGKPTPLSAGTILAEGDKVIAIGRPDCEPALRDQLIGEPEG